MHRYHVIGLSAEGAENWIPADDHVHLENDGTLKFTGSGSKGYGFFAATSGPPGSRVILSGFVEGYYFFMKTDTPTTQIT